MSEKDLGQLLAQLEIHQHDGVWSYHTQSDPVLPMGAVFLFREREGWSVLQPASNDTPAENRFVWIELTVHSDLHAVGFLAEIARKLAQHDVPCNAIAAKHHDHLFIPEDLAARYDQGSPINLLPSEVEQVLVNGKRDGIVPISHVRPYFEKAKSLKEKIEFIEVDNAGHFEVIAPGSVAWPFIEKAIMQLSKKRIKKKLLKIDPLNKQ